MLLIHLINLIYMIIYFWKSFVLALYKAFGSRDPPANKSSTFSLVKLAK